MEVDKRWITTPLGWWALVVAWLWCEERGILDDDEEARDLRVTLSAAPPTLKIRRRLPQEVEGIARQLHREIDEPIYWEPPFRVHSEIIRAGDRIRTRRVMPQFASPPRHAILLSGRDRAGVFIREASPSMNERTRMRLVCTIDDDTTAKALVLALRPQTWTLIDAPNGPPPADKAFRRDDLDRVFGRPVPKLRSLPAIGRSRP